jgi:FtsP/CotA-like multicopper oxidase with cupredoxin domain
VPKPIPPAVIALLLATAIARADTQAAPSWLKADPASRRAEVDVVAAFNENNTNWNFNGHHTGNATLLVPVGWTVEIAFRNHEAEIPHSLVVTADPGDEARLPAEAGRDAAAFPGAHTEDPVVGTGHEGSESFSFRADKPGDFLWYCGVPGHGNAGMWVRFRVAGDLGAPALEVAGGAEPGRE